MPFFQGTPEARLTRSDSKDPATTCKGITASGRPCRRSLAASTQSTPSKSPRNKTGVIAILPDVADVNLAAAAFFCFQHKDQARSLDDGSLQGRTKVIDLKQKTSIDTLADRLGVLDVCEANDGKTAVGHGRKVVKRDTLPPKWQRVPGSLMAVPKEASAIASLPAVPKSGQSRPFGEPGLFLSLFGCVKISEPYDLQPPRKSDSKVVYAANAYRVSRKPVRKDSLAPSRDAAHSFAARPSSNPTLQQRPMTDMADSSNNGRPQLERDPSSHTQQLLSLIPRMLSPQITSLLLSELSKPFSSFDRDTSGWIYIYWITPEEADIPDADTATSLLSTSPRSLQTARHPGDVIRNYINDNASATSRQQTILLKIGRATNVQRRLNQWSRQCGFNLSLVRYYPYQSSSSPLAIPRKAPYIQRVERLIHLELSEKRVKRACWGCSREHREWFEMDASRGAVRAIDEVIQRWVAWAEARAGSLD